MSNCCSHGTLLHFSLQSSRLNICYYHQDLHSRRLHPGSRPRLQRSPRRPSYSPGRGVREASHCPGGPVSARRSSAIHFQGCSIRQVSCYTLLSGFRLPWPPSCCLYRPTPFMGSDERLVRRLNRAFGSSHSASSAYQKWPTWHSHSRSRPREFRPGGLLTHLKFENRLRSFRPQGL